MLVIAHHNISDPEAFWKSAKENTTSLPGSLKLHAVYPSKDKKTGTCIWEAENVNEVQSFIDKIVGNYAKNFCYELNENEAMGMPQIKQTLAHAN